MPYKSSIKLYDKKLTRRALSTHDPGNLKRTLSVERIDLLYKFDADIVLPSWSLITMRHRSLSDETGWGLFRSCAFCLISTSLALYSRFSSRLSSSADSSSSDRVLYTKCESVSELPLDFWLLEEDEEEDELEEEQVGELESDSDCVEFCELRRADRRAK